MNQDKELDDLFKMCNKLGCTLITERSPQYQKDMKKLYFENKESIQTESIQTESESIRNLHNFGCKYLLNKEDKQGHKKAFDILNDLAEKGDVDSMYRLSFMYYRGIGTKKDLKKFFKYHKKLADKKYVNCAFHISENYYNGIGVEKDLEKAKEYCIKSIEDTTLEFKYNITVPKISNNKKYSFLKTINYKINKELLENDKLNLDGKENSKKVNSKKKHIARFKNNSFVRPKLKPYTVIPDDNKRFENSLQKDEYKKQMKDEKKKRKLLETNS
jgi:TPR repeat protein